jgi:chemotaxis protein methyltransferase CheR
MNFVRNASMPDMTSETFDYFRSIVYDKSGIYLNNSKEALVRARVSKRMRALDIPDFSEYLRYVVEDSSGTEIEQLLDAISTNTTSFYREADHFDLMHNIVRQWITDGLRNLRVWSAAASTGEEPYTLAIELKECIGASPVNVKILATDIAPSVLMTAQRGEYDEEKVEPIPKLLKSKYFHKKTMGHKSTYMVKDELKKMIMYRQYNLSIFPFPIKRPLDIILCRNVMIYFDAKMRKKMAVEFERILKPGGYLLIGHAESLTGMASRLKCLKPSVYIKE